MPCGGLPCPPIGGGNPWKFGGITPGGGNGIPPGIPGIGGPLPAGESEGGKGGKGGMPRPPAGGIKGGGAPGPPWDMLKGGGGMPATWCISSRQGVLGRWALEGRVVVYREIRMEVGESLDLAWVEDRLVGLAWDSSLLGLRLRRRR